MDRKIAEALSSKNSRQQSMVLEEDPFFLEVMAVPLPRGFKQPKMEKYDGYSDPIDHLRSFVDLMRLQATPMQLCVELFHQRLGGRPGTGWPPFLQNRFGKDELLKDFIVRFNRATLGIKELQMSTVVTAMMSGTRNRHFKMSLSKKSPNAMHELLRRGEKYVDVEEAYLITKGMKDEPKSNKRKISGELEPQNNRGRLT
ncbi:Retrotransposon gag protein [Abeliophyllum distichum]|uniref:Retrotransposon gag protein n=1 Tax=Abeliophyllum distichum TaxID=126358 RepID=A0ABD1RQ27_9LAMI